jgi:histidinol-phosphate/aromatic aminotransferase/cobyric acid decarboxylase-like protein/choline kinase
MQAIILAAGMGNRLGKYTKNNTKCMLSINGKTLAERTLDSLDDAGICKCIIVVGYKKENVIAFLGNRYKNIDITYISNDIYDKTNNIYSLYLAKDHLLQDDTLLLESDLIFESRLVSDMITAKEQTIAAVARFESWMDGTVVQLTDDKKIVDFIPKKLFNYNDKNTYYKTVNIYKFSRNFSQNTYVPFLEAYISSMGHNEYYEQVLRVVATLDNCELKAFVLSDHKWYEIDDVQDKDIAEVIFSETADKKLNLISSRYGGYWRFPKLLDFCYLVNPYFPPEQMRSEMKAYFDELLTQYPSCLNVQNLLMAKMFNLDSDNVLSGNGAAELIKATAQAIEGKIGIIYPTFNEYPERLNNVEQIPLGLEGINYDIDDLFEWSQKCDTLLLINPDNPSGNYIPRTDIIRLLESLKVHNKKLLLDESFVDFCDKENESLLCQNILEAFPNLIVIKSLSKSYGIPGLRLGALACGDVAFVNDVRRHIPIWNINSFAEYFLQTIGKYVKEYRYACRLIVQERNRFQSELEKTGLFTVYSSQANYFLCRLNNCINASDLSLFLLDKHDIFIKDLSGKKGFSDGFWVRLAIRNRDDNDRLIEKLKLFRI